MNGCRCARKCPARQSFKRGKKKESQLNAISLIGPGYQNTRRGVEEEKKDGREKNARSEKRTKPVDPSGKGIPLLEKRSLRLSIVVPITDLW